MKDNFFKDFGGGMVIGVILTAIIFSTSIPDWKAESIKRGCAEYNTQTGDFQWKDKE